MYSKYCIDPAATLLEAMSRIDETANASAVVRSGEIVKGIITDGDIRRAIIKGASLHEAIKPYYTADFISVGPEATRSDVLALMQAHFIGQIPIVDSKGRLQGIHTLHCLLGNDIKPNAAVIMAGGKGTRLGKLTEKIPKPMLKVAGRPILEHLILHLISYGIRTVYIAVNHLSHVIEEYFEDGEKWGCSIAYLKESSPLGSGGALSLLPDSISDAVVLLNGDVMLEANIAQMLLFHEEHDYYATMGIHHYSHEVPFGCVEFDNGRITDLNEKPLITKCVNAGVYVLSPAALAEIPCDEFFPITKLFETALEKDLALGAYPLDGDWFDVGMPDQLKQVRGQI